jgi:cytochrome c5
MGIAVGFGVVAAIFVMMLFISLLGTDDADQESEDQRSERLKPVGQVQVEGVVPPPEVIKEKSGKEVFETVCKACHTPPGVPPAPQLGDKASWGDRLAKGEAALVQNALNGIGIMPPKGGADFSDDEVKKAVQYMLEAVGVESSAPEPVKPEPQATTGLDLAVGKQVYESTCGICHNMGIVGAPKFGDKALWAPRIEKGMDTLVTNAVKGFAGETGVMPPKGGKTQLSDDKVKNAVAYMLDAAGADIQSTSEETAPESATAPEKPAEPAARAEPAAPAEPSFDLAKGEQIYTKACFVCHLTGIAGAPKFGDKALWAPRIEKGMDTLVTNAVQGFTGETGVMPPKGGQTQLTDEEVKNAVAYMLDAVGADVQSTSEESAPESAPEKPAVPAEAAAPTEPSLDLAKGEQIYTQGCVVCHLTGVANAPKLGDKTAWAPRIAKGMDALFTTALQGMGAMPPRGMLPQAPDDDIKAAVAYMVSKAQ